MAAVAEPLQTTQSAVAPAQPMVMHARVVSGAGGGPDKTILNSPRHLTAHGYRCVCLYLRPPGDEGFAAIARRADQWQAPIVAVDDRGPFDWRIIRRVLEVCRRENVAVWHGHDYKSNLLGLALHRWHPMRLVTTVHGWVHRTRRTGLYYALDRWALRRYDRVICVSQDLADQCAAFGVPRDRLLQIDNAIDCVEFCRRQEIATAKQSLGWPAKRLLIGSVGRLAAEKGYDLLIQSLASLVAEGRDVGLAIAGDGPERSTLTALIQDLRLGDRVRLLGFVADPRPFYEAMDVYALSSLREGLPNVLLEAMAVGAPIVATSVAGVPRLLDGGEGGMLVAPGDIDQMTAGLTHVLDDTDKRRRFAEAGLRIVAERYSFAARMAKVAAVYDDVLTE
jgi:glycosyltransferase involved in cell wall biosynthesis